MVPAAIPPGAVWIAIDKDVLPVHAVADPSDHGLTAGTGKRVLGRVSAASGRRRATAAA